MNITFRTQLLGGVTDFCTESGLSMATPEVLVDLIVRLVRYREEGVILSPEVYLTDNIDLLISMLPEGEKLSLSSANTNISGIEEMLKICAPLATGEWKIFGHQRKGGFNFGVFRGSSSPISVSVDDIVLGEQGGANVIKAHQVADACVHIRNSNGSYHNIFFNNRKQDSPAPLFYVEKLIRSIVRRVDENDKEAVRNLLTKILTVALLKSHGCILAVTNMRRLPKILAGDAVRLADPIDFPSLVGQLKRQRNAGSMSYILERKAELLEGMICSDGITLFDECGRVLAYRCFVRLSRTIGVIGGSRRRAFVTLKGHIGRGFSSVFIQSQDGWSDFEEMPK